MFDGHGGHAASQYASSHLSKYVTEHPEFRSDISQALKVCPPAATTPGGYGTTTCVGMQPLVLCCRLLIVRGAHCCTSLSIRMLPSLRPTGCCRDLHLLLRRFATVKSSYFQLLSTKLFFNYCLDSSTCFRIHSCGSRPSSPPPATAGVAPLRWCCWPVAAASPWPTWETAGRCCAGGARPSP